MLFPVRLAFTAPAVVVAIWAAGCTSILGGDYRAVDSPSEGGGGGDGGASAGVGGQGSGGAGAQGGLGPEGGTGGVAPLACPRAEVGPAMIEVAAPDATYCVDATEVTREAYSAFVEAGVVPQSISGTPAECAWNTDYTPTEGYPPGAKEALLPVVQVDWCDALAYCAWAGRRLCGRFGGGPVEPTGATDPEESEWSHACTNGGTTVYPYGDAFEQRKCNVGEFFGGEIAPVGTYPDCRGEVAPFALIFDLSGNAAEWENSCELAGAGANDECMRRGGFYSGAATSVRCDAALSSPRGLTNNTTSFRCCADLE